MMARLVLVAVMLQVRMRVVAQLSLTGGMITSGPCFPVFEPNNDQYGGTFVTAPIVLIRESTAFCAEGAAPHITNAIAFLEGFGVPADCLRGNPTRIGRWRAFYTRVAEFNPRALVRLRERSSDRGDPNFMQGRFFTGDRTTARFHLSSIVGCAMVVGFKAEAAAAAAQGLNGTLLVGDNEVGAEFKSAHYFAIFRVVSVV